MIIPTIKLEQKLWSEGYLNVAGVDEAGRGPLAGPVTAGAVVIHNEKQVVKSVRDSKLITPLQREKAYGTICNKSFAYGTGIVTHEEIDMIGIDMAAKKAMLLALQNLETNFRIHLDYVLVDGSKTKILETYVTQRILKGGLHHYTIAAGSVLAKVTRDRCMYEYAKSYPEYGFDRHVGYGTSYHLQTLDTYGPCPVHRKTFEPVKKYVTQSV